MSALVEVDGKALEAVQGDITDYTGDAIVNAANNHFWMGGGVAGAIKRAGGSIIEDEAMRQGPKPVGQSIITTGGRLKAKYVIHAAVMGQDLQTDRSKIRMATRSFLELAEQSNVHSIGVPALGTGVGGFPVAEAARIMVDESIDFLKRSNGLKRITFVLFTHDAYEYFSDEILRFGNRRGA